MYSDFQTLSEKLFIMYFGSILLCIAGLVQLMIGLALTNSLTELNVNANLAVM